MASLARLLFLLLYLDEKAVWLRSDKQSHLIAIATSLLVIAIAIVKVVPIQIQNKTF